MNARLASLALLLTLLSASTAAAFPGSRQDVDIVYDAARAPLALASGAVTLDGSIRGTLLIAEAVGTRLGPIPAIEVASQDGGGHPLEGRVYQQATLVLHEGALLLRPNDTAVGLSLVANYALAVAVAEAGEQEGASGAFLLAGRALAGTISLGAGSSDLIPLDAVVSLRDAQDRAIDGWDHRHVNTGRGADDFGDGGGDGVGEAAAILRASGAYSGALSASVALGLLGDAPSLEVSARPADEVDFEGALQGFRRFEGVAGGFAAGQMDDLAPISEVLNGGVLVLAAGGEDGEPPTPRSATLDGEPADLGGFALLRSEEARMSWASDEMRIQASDALAVTGRGVAAAPPMMAGPVPLLAVVLWLAAIGAVVYYFVRRPPKPDAKFWPLRLAGMGAYVVAMVVAFWWWDRQFAESFGTSFLEMLIDGGASGDPMPMLVVLSLELLPWGLVAVLFALPVRIALGVGLRYLGKGKALKGFAKAGGYLALALLGPFYAMWVLNVILARAVAMLSGA